MQRFVQTKHRNVAATVCAAGVLIALAGVRAQADQWDKKTYLTIDQPVQVTETVLQPGKYVFKLLDSSSDRHIVQIYNSDQSHLINTVLAVPNYRLRPTGKSQFAFWETPTGSAHALRAWFYPGDNFGQEFAYPKQLAMLQAADVRDSRVAETPMETPAAQAAPASEPEAKPEPAPQQPVDSATAAPAAKETDPQPAQQPTEIAQNNPTPRSPTAQPDSAPAPTPDQGQPSRLPSTASPYSLVGLIGLFSVGLFGLLKLTRLA